MYNCIRPRVFYMPNTHKQNNSSIVNRTIIQNQGLLQDFGIVLNQNFDKISCTGILSNVIKHGKDRILIMFSDAYYTCSYVV